MYYIYSLKMLFRCSLVVDMCETWVWLLRQYAYFWPTMKHLPNLLTLGNLFCGCIAIAYILTAQPYVYQNISDGHLQWIMGTEQLYMGTIFIFIAAICDMLDGFVARALQVYSPIGQDLDSLADMVSFGVAPSVILYKCLWDANMQNAFDVNMLAMAPAFLIACFAALRLATFNITTTEQKTHFIGMPTPAVGLFVGSFPMIMWYNPMNLANVLHNRYYLYILIAVLGFLMVSKIKFFKMIPTKKGMKYMWPQLVLVIATLVAIPLLQVAALPFAFILYVLLSLVTKYPDAEAAAV